MEGVIIAIAFVVIFFCALMYCHRGYEKPNKSQTQRQQTTTTEPVTTTATSELDQTASNDNAIDEVLAQGAPVQAVSRNGETTTVTISSNVRRVAAVLHLDGEQSNIDLPSAISLEYISRLNNFPISIINVGDGNSTLISTLDQLYADGFRIFIGFNSCADVSQALPWFEAHKDTLAITLVGNCQSGNVVGKNMIRLTVSYLFTSFYLSKFIKLSGYKDVYIFTNTERQANIDIRDSLTRYISTDPRIQKVEQINLLDLLTDQSSKDAVATILPTIPKDAIMVLLLEEDLPVFLDIENVVLEGQEFPDQIFPFDINVEFSPQQAEALSESFYQIRQPTTRDLSNLEIMDILGQKYFEPNAYDAYNIARVAGNIEQLENVYNVVDHMLSHNGTLILNNFNDRAYSRFVINKWINGTWDPYWYMGNNPRYGIFVSRVIYRQAEL